MLQAKTFHNAVKELVSDGKFFTVEFIKKNGERRVLNGRTGVHKYLKGGKLRYNPISKGLLNVWEPANGYRTINLKTIRRITAKRGTLNVQDNNVVYSIIHPTQNV